MAEADPGLRDAVSENTASCFIIRGSDAAFCETRDRAAGRPLRLISKQVWINGKPLKSLTSGSGAAE
jgi:hypothetical protein